MVRRAKVDSKLGGSVAESTESTATSPQASSLIAKSCALQEALQPALNLVMTSSYDRTMLVHAMIADGLASQMKKRNMKFLGDWPNGRPV